MTYLKCFLDCEIDSIINFVTKVHEVLPLDSPIAPHALGHMYWCVINFILIIEIINIAFHYYYYSCYYFRHTGITQRYGPHRIASSCCEWQYCRPATVESCRGATNDASLLTGLDWRAMYDTCCVPPTAVGVVVATPFR